MTAAACVGAAQWQIGGLGIFGFWPEIVMTAAIALSIGVIIVASVVRSVGFRRLDWLPAAFAFFASAGAIVLWKSTLLPDIDASKRVAWVLFSLKPIIAASGVAAAFCEWRALRSA